MVRKGLADISSFVLAQQREAANLGYAYPAQFSDHVLQGADDEHIAATVGLQEAPRRPGLIVVHGLFSSRRFDYVRQIAVHAYYEWGFNVLALDLRSFGLTNLTSQAPTTVGWKEGEDVVAAGRYLKQLGATTVGALGISLGGSAVLGACHAEDADETLDGGILAVSPPADVKAMAKRLSRRLPLSHPAYAINRGFWAMLTSRIREAGWEGIEDFVDPDRAGLGSVLRRRGGGALAAGLRQGAHRRRPGAGARAAPGRRPDHPGRARADARRGGEGQRPGARLDPSRRRPRRDRRRGPGVVLRRGARFLRALGGVRGADDAAGDDSHADQPPVKLIYSAAR